MAYTTPIYGAKTYGLITQSANTKIVRLVEPMLNAVTRLAEVVVTASTTAHTLTILRPMAVTTVASAAAAAQAVINITADPGKYAAASGGAPDTADDGIAANDWCVYQTADGNWVVDTVSSVSTLAITMTTNVPTSTVLAGAPFFFMGIETDTNPNDHIAHAQFNITASTTIHLGVDPGESLVGVFGTIPGKDYNCPTGGFTLSNSIKAGGGTLNGVQSMWKQGKFMPLVLVDSNATAAGTIERVTAVYTGN